MGCWNGTCLLTNLPIPHNEPIKLIFILSQAHQDGSCGYGFCYPEDQWRPLGCPIDGLYNDYGYIKKIVDNEAHAAVMGKLVKMYGNADFEKSIHEGSLPLIDGQQLSFCMIPVDIYKGVVEFIGSIESLRQTIAGKVGQDKGRWSASDQTSRTILEECQSNIDNAFPSYWTDVPLEEVVDFKIFCRAMKLLRTRWCPPSGMGSQFEGYDLYAHRAKLVQEYCQKQLSKEIL